MPQTGLVGLRSARPILFVALALVPSWAWPQGNPVGPEFRVNTYTTNSQFASSIAAGPSGNFVIAWNSPQDGSTDGIYGQRYAASGIPLGAEFRINTYTTGFQDFPAVAADSSGNFVAVWVSEQDGSLLGIYGQRYSASGAPAGPEFRVNTYTTNTQYYPSVAADSAGNFMVVWQSIGVSDRDVFGQRFASSGAPLGPQFRVNTTASGYQYAPNVAADAAGNFVVVWTSLSPGVADGVFGQRFASSGVPIGPEFRANTYTPGPPFQPRVASDPSGNFVVVWTSRGQDDVSLGVFGQRFASTGAPLGPEFRVNTYTTGLQYSPSVATDLAGDFVVVWESYGQASLAMDVFGQRYASSGTPLGPEFRVNTHTSDREYLSAVASDASGNFVVTWTSYGNPGLDGSGRGVFGQRYNMIVPVELMQFRVE